jgi:lipoprotein-releasing system permease protein
VKALELPEGLETTRLLGAVPGLAQSFRDLEGKGATPVLVGAGLATRLGAARGSTIVLETSSVALAAGLSVAARTPLTIAAIAETGFSEVDDGWAVVPLAVFERLAPPGARQGVWEMKLAKASASGETVAAARALLGEGATVLDWKVLNRDLFQALAVQQTLLFIVLTLIVAVAAGTVVSSLVVLLAEKTRDVGVLAALGASPAVVSRTFRLSGMLLGGSGLVLGVLFGLLVCFLLTAFRVVRFPPEIAKVYYLTWMPFRPEPLHVLAILGVGLLLVLVASLLPAARAARMNPSEALRYE